MQPTQHYLKRTVPSMAQKASQIATTTRKPIKSSKCSSFLILLAGPSCFEITKCSSWHVRLSSDFAFQPQRTSQWLALLNHHRVRWVRWIRWGLQPEGSQGHEVKRKPEVKAKKASKLVILGLRAHLFDLDVVIRSNKSPPANALRCSENPTCETKFRLTLML